MFNGRSPPILFDVNGGAFDTGSVTEDTITCDVAFEIEANVSREGYTFDGWYTATEGGIKVTSGVKWVISSEIVTLHAY